MLSSFVFLALAALAAAAPVQDQPPPALVNRTIYDALALYAGYTQLPWNETCEQHYVPGALYKSVESKETDTQVAIWKVDANKEFVVSIPGTAGLCDDLTDFDFILRKYRVDNVDCPSCYVHEGFQDAWISVQTQVQEILTNSLDMHPDYTVTLTGHSLGGALVSIAFPSLRNGPYNVTQAYTYGQPRTGNRAFANYVDSISGASDTEAGIYYRVTHANDVVPKLPPRKILFRYKHSRTEYWESTASIDNAQSTYRCYGQEPADCNSNTTGFDRKAHTTYAGMDAKCESSLSRVGIY